MKHLYRTFTLAILFAMAMPVMADVSKSGSVTSATTVTNLLISPYPGCGFQVSAIGSGNTLVAEASPDNSNWTARQVYNPVTQLTAASVTATGTFAVLLNSGDVYVRIRVSIYGSGTVTVLETANNIAYPVTATSSGGGSSNVNATIVAPLGQTIKSGSLPVTIASDQGPITDSTPGSANITIQDSGSSTTTGQNSCSIITGTPTANSSVSVSNTGRGGCRIQISGTWTGTLQFEISPDGTNYYVTNGLVSGTAFRQSAVTGNGLFFVDAAGMLNVRVRATAAMTGTAAVNFWLTNSTGIVKTNQPTSIVDNTTGLQVSVSAAGTPASNALIVQGNASGVAVPVSGAVTITPSGTQDTNVKQVNGVTTSTGAGATGTGTIRVGVAQDTTTIAGSAPGTAGSASTNVVTVQGIASATPVASNTAQVNGVTTSTGTGAVGTGTQRVAVGTDTATIAGSAPGTAGSASSNVVTVQGVASMTPIITGNTQASTTSGQSGPLVQGATTTSAPSYTTAQTNPVSLTTAGGLRSDVASIAGTTTLTDNGASGAGAIRVTIANNSTGVVGLNTGTNVVGVFGNTQGSTTSGQSGPLAQGAVTTSAPSYTTAQTSPLSLTTAGALRHDMTSIAGTTTDTNSGNKSAGTLRVVIATDQPQLTNKLLVTPDANSAVNEAQFNGHTVIEGGPQGVQAMGGAAATNNAIGTSAGNTAYPVNIGFQGVTAENTATTTGNGTQAISDVQGRQIVMPYQFKENWKQGTSGAVNNTTSTSIIAGVASNNLYITTISCTNSGATAGVDLIQDGSGGTTIMTVGVPAGGGSNLTFPVPLKVPTAGNGLFFAPGASSTSNYCTAVGYYGK